MAGASMKIELVTREITAAFKQLRELGGEASLDELFYDIGPDLVRRHTDRAALQIAPDGTPWAPLDENYAARKEKKRPGVPILVFDYHMLGDMFGYQVGGGELAIGTNAIWGATQHFGDDERGIEARPFLGLAPDDVDAILDIAREHLDRAATV